MSQQPPGGNSRPGQGQSLPPIRDLFRAELSQTFVAPSNAPGAPSASANTHYRHLPEPNHHHNQYSAHRGIPTAGYSYASHSGHAGPTSNVSPPRHSSGHEPINAHYTSYGQSSHMVSRQIDPNALAASGYPYAVSQPYPPHAVASEAGSSNRAERLPQDASPAEGASAHSGKYECEWCLKTFTRPSGLKIHMNTHTGEKPYQCTWEGCGRRFSVQSNMRRHARSHLKDLSPGALEVPAQMASMADEEEEPESVPLNRVQSGDSDSSASGRTTRG